MNLVAKLQSLTNQTCRDEDGGEWKLKLLPPMSDAEIAALEKKLPCPMPADIRAALKFARGVENNVGDRVEIAALDDSGFGIEEIFPFAHALANDGAGNFWVVDLLPDSTAWGPVYFACHDAPVIIYQSADVAEFLDAYLKLEQSPGKDKGPLHQVAEIAVGAVWANEPNKLDRAEALAKGDVELKTFAESLDDSWRIFDLRNAKTGDGFAWGRAKSPDDITRWKTLPIFAYKPKKSLMKRLFGK